MERFSSIEAVDRLMEGYYGSLEYKISDSKITPCILIGEVHGDPENIGLQIKLTESYKPDVILLETLGNFSYTGGSNRLNLPPDRVTSDNSRRIRERIFFNPESEDSIYEWKKLADSKGLLLIGCDLSVEELVSQLKKEKMIDEDDLPSWSELVFMSVAKQQRESRMKKLFVRYQSEGKKVLMVVGYGHAKQLFQSAEVTNIAFAFTKGKDYEEISYELKIIIPENKD